MPLYWRSTTICLFTATLDGNGAALLADINVSVSRGIEAVFAIVVRYFNIDPSNTPEAALEFTGLANPEQNASLELTTLGSLSTIVPTKSNSTTISYGLMD